MSTAEFQAFPKISRMSREMIVTEKLDGTNAQILIDPVVHIGAYEEQNGAPLLYSYTPDDQFVAIWAGSRKRWLKPTKDQDNFGFAAWVFDNYADLLNLGVGRHYGEWWGKGIQRGYGLDHRRFSLFNVSKWSPSSDEIYPGTVLHDGTVVAPSCCHVVPFIYQGPFDTDVVTFTIMGDLREHGSFAAPGFMNPEGVVVFHTHSRTLFKKTFENDSTGKEAA